MWKILKKGEDLNFRLRLFEAIERIEIQSLKWGGFWRDKSEINEWDLDGLKW
jgi:hypothetical protein